MLEKAPWPLPLPRPVPSPHAPFLRPGPVPCWRPCSRCNPGPGRRPGAFLGSVLLTEELSF